MCRGKGIVYDQSAGTFKRQSPEYCLPILFFPDSTDVLLSKYQDLNCFIQGTI